MSRPIHVDYTHVAELVQRTDVIEQAMYDESLQIDSLKNAIVATMQGAGVDGYNDVQTQWDSKMQSYRASLANLNSKVNSVLGPGGFVNSNDIEQGKRFPV
ncbi:WXG100 family type VII secretion target [Nocardia sp. CDC160]|uniref:WXG100 family type VII secretion target n=1 Tax=Nocardia sp. CDC160 TaxID=3112166 RepID=UPI002DB94C90|nr:WXG100 family type VII secretion target [Nocardia sp. CDC160]MEC3920216.1 WXG100 family type VII secretion target [Nocardia sp. CDC160]